MNFEKGLEPNSRLKEASNALKKAQAKIPGLQDRHQKQIEAVEKMSDELNQQLDAKAWEKEIDPVKVLSAKKKVTDLNEQLQQEQELLPPTEVSSKQTLLVAVAGVVSLLS